MSEFADSFFSIPLYIQQYRPDLISPDIDVINNYAISGSESRDDTTISQASKVQEYVINCMNRCNIGEEDVFHRTMRVVYSERK